MARAPRSLASSVTLTVPLWLVAALPVLLVLLVLLGWSQSSLERQQLAQLEARAYKLSLELEAEKSRNEAYGIEAVQLQQSLKVLEAEINRLRAKAGLPRLRLPEPAQPNPVPRPDGAPRGPASPLIWVTCCSALRSQVEGFAAELEATALPVPYPPGCPCW
ncbi:hypothetical protein [Meiothermus taiwanensis]|uniref:hypothetical protein n=1 Tax=Meiothermus taiwanensis TaxID=172827 RepID=UPI000A5C4E51|nr:hypothetical protein [Meiothermus taiwanensis]